MNIWFFLLLVLCIPACSCELYFVAKIVSIGLPETISKSWVGHSNELAQIGMRRLYILGRDFSERYLNQQDVLSKQYLPFEVALHSAYENWELTTNSINAFARGLNYPGLGQNLTNGIGGSAIPSYKDTDSTKYQKELDNFTLLNKQETLSAMMKGEGRDHMLSADSHCESISKIIKDYVKEHSQLKDRREKLNAKEKTKIYGKLSKLCDIDINSIEDALKCRDYIIAAKYFSINIDEDPKIMVKLLNEMNEYVRCKDFYANLTIAKIVANKVLEDIVFNADSKHPFFETSEKRRKSVIYMVKDQVISAILGLLSQNISSEYIDVPFTSSLEFVFTKVPGSEKTRVEVNFNGINLNWEGNKKAINLDKFMQWVDSNTLSDSELISLNEEDKSEEDDYPWIISGFVMAAIMLGIVVWTIIYSAKGPRRERKVTKETA